MHLSLLYFNRWKEQFETRENSVQMELFHARTAFEHLFGAFCAPPRAGPGYERALRRCAFLPTVRLVLNHQRGPHCGCQTQCSSIELDTHTHECAAPNVSTFLRPFPHSMLLSAKLSTFRPAAGRVGRSRQTRAQEWRAYWQALLHERRRDARSVPNKTSVANIVSLFAFYL